MAALVTDIVNLFGSFIFARQRGVSFIRVRHAVICESSRVLSKVCHNVTALAPIIMPNSGSARTLTSSTTRPVST